MGTADFLDPFNWAALLFTVGLTSATVYLSWDATLSEAMYLHGVLNVVAFAMMISMGISKQVALVLKWKKDPENYLKHHKQRHTFMNALAMVPVYAALYIGQRARSQPDGLGIANNILALSLVSLVFLNFALCIFQINQARKWATPLAWGTGAVSAVSTVLLITEGPPPSVTHHYLGIAAVFMYQAIILRFFVSYGFEKDDMKSAKMTHFREGKTLYGLFWLVLSPLAYLGDGIRMLRGWNNVKGTPSTSTSKVGKYLDHIVWGFATLGIAIGAVVTGIALYGDWYGTEGYQDHLYAIMGLGLSAFVFVPLLSF